VPISHATPGAAIATVNRRAKYDNDIPALDNILQESLRQYQPTVLLGGGHPLDFENKTDVGPVYKYTYIKQSTYDELRNNPNNNRYGYTFVERGSNAATKLLNAAKLTNPEQGGRLLGLFGARGQNGNLPTSSANGDYSSTGLDNFSLFSTQGQNPDKTRPLSPGETDAQFIAREVAENPTLKDMTQAALEVLGKDKDGSG
jgi:alkaline phosphatase